MQNAIPIRGNRKQQHSEERACSEEDRGAEGEALVVDAQEKAGNQSHRHPDKTSDGVGLVYVLETSKSIHRHC